MDAVLLSRIQFAVTIAFHYLYPPLSIGLGILLVFIEGKYLKTRNPLYRQMGKFWTRVFGLTFSLGVATGIVMEFQFGTNWSNYSRYVGDVFGSALAAEGIFAFFLESGFLALLIFGWDRIGPKLHFFSTLMVCLGAHFSAVWIVVADSWMQTPAGFHIVTEMGRTRAEVTDFWAVVFNPSAMIRLQHTLLGCWQAGAFLMISVSAWYMLKKKHVEFARASMGFGLILAVIATLGSLVTGHDSGQVVGEYQPAKLAAMEGHWEAETPADMYLMGWVNEDTETTHGIKVPIPGMLGFLLSGDRLQSVTGLKAFAPEDRPPVNPVFISFHTMVAIGMTLIAITLGAVFLWWKKRLAECRWFLWILVFAVLGPQIANQLGWMTAEIGRQPWIVYNLMRTADGVSPNVSAGNILASLIMFTLIYTLLFGLFIFLLDQKIKHGPFDDDLLEKEGRA